MHLYGMTDIANQEVGARVQGEPDCFLVHPYGLLFEEVRASDLVKVSLDGVVIDGPGIWAGSGRESFVAHAGERWVSDGGVNLGRWIFGTRPDCGFFIHAHCEDVMAVSATEGGLRPVNQAYIYLREYIAYLGYDFAEDNEYAALFREAIAEPRHRRLASPRLLRPWPLGGGGLLPGVLPAPGVLGAGQGGRPPRPARASTCARWTPSASR